jgi:hypothetical protein
MSRSMSTKRAATGGEEPCEEQWQALFAAADPASEASGALLRRLAALAAEHDARAAASAHSPRSLPFWRLRGHHVSPVAATLAAGLLLAAFALSITRRDRSSIRQDASSVMAPQGDTHRDVHAPRPLPRPWMPGTNRQAGPRRLVGPDARGTARPGLTAKGTPPASGDTSRRQHATSPAFRRGNLFAMNEHPAVSVHAAVPVAEQTESLEARVRRQIPVRDDFVSIPFPRLVSTSDRQIAAAVENYQREAAVIDTRLSREITVQQKATALSELCERLRADTGVQLAAGSSVGDEKVTLFCEKRPLREVMRQLSLPFGYTWLRSGKTGEYKYELVQDLRSQLLEEELRNRERNAALLALDREMQRYRKYLDLAPDEALARAQTAAPEEKKLLERLAKDGWGPIQMYFRLSPNDFAALKSGQELTFSAEPDPDDGLAPRPLPADIARGVFQSLRDVRVVRRDDGFMPAEPSDLNGLRLTAVPEARALLMLRPSQSELGQFTLGGGSGYRALGTIRVFGAGAEATDRPYAIGQSPASAHPDNRQANASLAGDPALRRRVSVRPQPSCEGARRPMPDTHQAQGAGRPIPGEPPSGKPQLIGVPAESPRSDGRSKSGELIRGGKIVEGTGAQPSGGRSIPGETASGKPRVTHADLLEALHRATGLPIVADAYTRLYEPEAVSLHDQPLFDALNQLADTTRLRWHFGDGKWLQFRSASYFNDRLKEVPNRLLARWSASRRQHGALTLADLAEIAQLSDAQLDAAEVAEGAQACFDLQEWPLAQGMARPHLRYLATLTQAQQQAAISLSPSGEPAGAQGTAGLAFRQMSLGQQQQFIQFAFYQYSKRPTAGIDLGELEGASLRVAYRQPGDYQWWPADGLRGDLPERAAELSLISGPTREEALQRARRIDPQIQPDAIVPAEPGVIFQYVHRQPLTIRVTLKNGASIYGRGAGG